MGAQTIPNKVYHSRDDKPSCARAYSVLTCKGRGSVSVTGKVTIRTKSGLSANGPVPAVC